MCFGSCTNNICQIPTIRKRDGIPEEEHKIYLVSQQQIQIQNKIKHHKTDDAPIYCFAAAAICPGPVTIPRGPSWGGAGCHPVSPESPGPVSSQQQQHRQGRPSDLVTISREKERINQSFLYLSNCSSECTSINTKEVLTITR